MRHLAGIVKTAVALLTGDGTEMDRDSAENWLVLADKYGVKVVAAAAVIFISKPQQ